MRGYVKSLFVNSTRVMWLLLVSLWLHPVHSPYIYITSSSILCSPQLFWFVMIRSVRFLVINISVLVSAYMWACLGSAAIVVACLFGRSARHGQTVQDE